MFILVSHGWSLAVPVGFMDNFRVFFCLCFIFGSWMELNRIRNPYSTHISKRVILKVLKLVDNQYHRIFLCFFHSFSFFISVVFCMVGAVDFLLLFIIICYKFWCWLKELNSNTKYSVSISSQTFDLSSHCLTLGFSLAVSLSLALQFRFTTILDNVYLYSYAFPP